MIGRIIETLGGRRKWLEIKRKYYVQDGTFVALFPGYEKEFHDSVIQNYDDFVARKYITNSIFLICNDEIEKLAEQYIQSNIRIVKVSENDCKKILLYYGLCVFYGDFTVFSLQFPKGNTVGRIIDSAKMNMDEFVLASFLN